MLAELLSLVTFPFNNITVSLAVFAVAQTCYVGHQYYKLNQQMKVMDNNLPEIEAVVTDQFPMEEKFKNCAKILHTLNAKLPQEAAQSLRKIGFYYPESGRKSHDARVMKIGQHYTLLIGTKALDVWTQAEKQAVMAHELGHVKCDDQNLYHYTLSILDDINRPLFNLLASAAVGLSVKSLFYWSEQMPSVIKLLIVSAAIGQNYKMHVRQREFRADQNILEFKQDPKAMISALEKAELLDSQLIEQIRHQQNLPPRNPNAVEVNISYNTIFSSYPSLEERRKALGITKDNSTQANAVRLSP